jgi:hypothetical protein
MAQNLEEAVTRVLDETTIQAMQSAHSVCRSFWPLAKDSPAPEMGAAWRWGAQDGR